MQQAFLDGKAHGRSRKGLGHGVEDVRRIRHEKLLLQHFPVLQDHHAVEVLSAVGHGLEVGREGLVQLRGGFPAGQRVRRAPAGHQQRARCR